MPPCGPGFWRPATRPTSPSKGSRRWHRRPMWSLWLSRCRASRAAHSDPHTSSVPTARYTRTSASTTTCAQERESRSPPRRSDACPIRRCSSRSSPRSLRPRALFSVDPTTGSLGERLRQNTPTDISAPLLVAQGTDDEMIRIAITRKWVAERCAAGKELEFRPYPSLTHMSLLASEGLGADLVSWTEDRFAAEPAPNTC
jgi:alpha-beta hydrolase superfamily lysophospholipase